jgi:phosphopantothenoylcysteine decarboxylase / phosphopantothenate---cysteine ligase
MEPDVWFVRDPALVAAARGDDYLFLPPGRQPVVIPGVADALGPLLELTCRPVAAAELYERCDADTVALLVAEGVLVRGTADELAARLPARATAGWRCRRVVLGLTGAIATLRGLDRALELADGLADEVEVVFTEAARRLVEPTAFEHFGLRTWFDTGPRHGVAVPHMHLATRADLVVIAPASADTLRKLATGSCEDLLSLVVAATEAPVVVAPAMNRRMWDKPAIARNVAQLRADGLWVVEPRAGVALSDRDNDVGAEIGALGADGRALVALLHAVLEQTG